MREADESFMMAIHMSNSLEHVLVAGVNTGFLLYRLHDLLFVLSFCRCILKVLPLHMLTLYMCLMCVPDASSQKMKCTCQCSDAENLCCTVISAFATWHAMHPLGLHHVLQDVSSFVT